LIRRLGMLWKKLIEQKVQSDCLWEGLSRRRGWIKYLFRQMLIANESSPTHEFYRNLYPKILHDIKQIEDNWRTGNFQSEKFQSR